MPDICFVMECPRTVHQRLATFLGVIPDEFPEQQFRRYFFCGIVRFAGSGALVPTDLDFHHACAL